MSKEIIKINLKEIKAELEKLHLEDKEISEKLISKDLSPEEIQECIISRRYLKGRYNSLKWVADHKSEKPKKKIKSNLKEVKKEIKRTSKELDNIKEEANRKDISKDNKTQLLNKARLLKGKLNAFVWIIENQIK